MCQRAREGGVCFKFWRVARESLPPVLRVARKLSCEKCASVAGNAMLEWSPPSLSRSLLPPPFRILERANRSAFSLVVSLSYFATLSLQQQRISFSLRVHPPPRRNHPPYPMQIAIWKEPGKKTALLSCTLPPPSLARTLSPTQLSLSLFSRRRRFAIRKLYRGWIYSGSFHLRESQLDSDASLSSLSLSFSL